MYNEIVQRGGGRRDELVVVLHGLRGSPEALRGVIDASAEVRPSADILAVPLPYAGHFGMFSVAPAECIAGTIVERIGRAVAKRQREVCDGANHYESIILVGHSFGGVLARKVAILAHGERPDAEFEPDIKRFATAQSWAHCIKRIVLLAGMSRGWSPESARNWLVAAEWTVGAWLGELFALLTLGLRRPTIAGIRQGAPFIVQTRLQWLALTRPRQGQRKAPTIFLVQLLGAADDLVAPDDTVDFACDVGGGDANFALIELPFATHDNAFCMTLPTSQQHRWIEQAVASRQLSVVCKRKNLTLQARAYLFMQALSKSKDELAAVAIDPADMHDTLQLHPDTDVTDIVFVIHGIRDHGFWTQKIARAIKQEAKRFNREKSKEPPRRYHSFTGSYGYFAMIPFVLPWIRRWKSEWLMDRYVEECARYPEARRSYVGHSNGTYLLARALKDYPALRLERIVFAGSVVRRDFDWLSYLRDKPGTDQPRVRGVLNYVATMDWVVGILSKAFQPLKFFFDLGSAGHDGFKQYRGSDLERPRDGREEPDEDRETLRNGLHEVHYIKGTHSAALGETQWDDIARYIVRDVVPPKPPTVDFVANRTWWLVALGCVSTLLVLLLLWTVVGFGVALALSVHGRGVVTLTPWVVHSWDGLSCAAYLPPTDVCRVFSPVGRWMVAVVNWFYGVLQGRISVPFADHEPSSAYWAIGRGACAIVYWWLVYVVATRF
jgi:pimeloyl-ACP methyl ester carboxylesterase